MWRASSRSDFPAAINFHSSGKAVEQFETKFFFQILDLTRKSGLRHAQAFGRAPVMLLFPDGHEIP